MPKTALQITGDPNISAFSTTRFEALAGSLQAFSAETSAQCTIRASLTLKNLFVRVRANTRNGATTFRTRTNAANGNLSVSVAAEATGTFEDTVNSDSLVSGDTSNYQIVPGGTTGSIQWVIISCTLEHATTMTSLLASTGPASVARNLTRYRVINGIPTVTATESQVQYRIRIAGTLSRLNVIVTANDLTGATTVRTRVNGANGGQSVSIAGGATGEFEDAVGTDSLVSADLINYQIVTGTGPVGSTISISKIQTHFENTTVDGFLEIAGQPNVLGSSVGSALTRYTTLAGFGRAEATESFTQTKIRGDNYTAKNLFVNVVTNSLNGATTFRVRKNGANGNLTLSVAAGATGIFEDTVNSDDFVPDDLANYQMVTGGTAGSINYGPVATQWEITAVVAIGRGDGFTWTWG